MKLASLMKKEFYRFFHDIRLIVTMILPGILIFAIYSLMGSVMHNTETEAYHYTVSVSGQSEVTNMIKLAVGEENITYVECEDEEAAKQQVKDGKISALLTFSENFDEKVAEYTPTSGETAPQVKIFYLSGDEVSFSFYMVASGVLDEFERTIANKFDVNSTKNEIYDFSETSDMAKSVMGSILPFLVVVLIFSSVMSITLESVAGEKERGTLATILATSAKRSDIALGKIIPLSCISAIGAASSFLGVVLSMPKLIGTSVSNFVGGVGFVGYLMIFLLILSIVPLIVSLISIVSTYAKSVKEASAYTSVLMILIMVLSLVSTFVSDIGDWIVAVPILNSVVCMQNILMMNVSVWQALVSIGLNFVYTGLLVFAISKMLSSERVMFGS